jgi:tetratricopeptide (TPR) repeat protein
MKKLLLYVLAGFLWVGCSEDTKSTNTAEALYELALENKDVTTAKVALSQLILEDSTNMDYKDSLSRIYFNEGNFYAGLDYAEQVFASGSNDKVLQENMAIAYQQIGETEMAEEIISGLFTSTKDYKYFFQKVIIQYENVNLPLFDSLSNQLLTLAQSDTLIAKTLVSMPSPISGGTQLVPIKAATLFLMGNNALERRQDINSGVNYLRESIEEYEKFEMPRYVLMELEKMMANQR